MFSAKQHIAVRNGTQLHEINVVKQQSNSKTNNLKGQNNPNVLTNYGKPTKLRR